MLYHFKISHMLFLPAGDHVTAGISDIRGVICWHTEKKKKKKDWARFALGSQCDHVHVTWLF